jgi:protein SCO1/2
MLCRLAGMLCIPYLAGSLLLASPAAVATVGVVSAAALPGDSIYQTPLSLEDQQGHRFDLAALRGKPVIVSMFYASCSSACPLTVDTIDQVRRAVGASGRVAPSVLMVSFDPQHDDMFNLAAMAKAHQLDPASWRLTRPTAGDVRAFAATLGIAWRRRASGEISHDTVIALLDGNGRLVAHTSLIGQIDPAFVEAVRQSVAGSR